MMNARRGVVVEIIPVLLIGVLLFVGAIQLALLMWAQHGTDLAAFRGLRAGEGARQNAPGAAMREARSTSRIAHPTGNGSASMIRASARQVTVDVQLSSPIITSDGTARVSSTHPPEVSR